MKLNIRGDKLIVTDAIKAYIEEKVSKLDKYFDNNDIEAKIVVRVANNKEIIEVTIPTSKYTLRAEESSKDLYASIDLVVDKLERQIRKNKTRIKNKYKNNEVGLNLNFEIENEEENDSKIVKRKNVEMKPMDEEEAILQTELLDHDFFVFKNVNEECVSVLYKRKDGKYGILNVK